MKLALIVVFASLLLCPQIVRANDKLNESKNAQGEEQEAVQAAERKWLQALFTLDSPTLKSDEDENFILISPAVVLTREEHLISVKQSLAHGTPPVSPVVFDISNQKIDIFGKLALLSDLVSVQNTDANAGITGGRYWQTEVWRREGGNWRIVHMHISPVRHGM